MTSTKRIVKFRRKLKGKTHYRKRLKLLKSGETRAVIRVTSRDTIIQFTNFNDKGDKVLISTNSKALKKMGWKYPTGNIVSSYLIGIIAGSQAKKQGIKSAVLDLGLQPNVAATRVYASLKGIVKAGVNIPHSASVLPDDNRVLGEHIAKFYEMAEKEQGKYKNQFAKLKKAGFTTTTFKKDIENIVNKALQVTK